MRSFAALACLGSWALLAIAAGEPETAAPAWKLSGHYKNLLVGSETVFPAGRRYVQDLNRLRLKIDGKPTNNLTLDVQYDNEIFLGNYLRTAQYQLQKSLPIQTYWTAQATYADNDRYFGQHRLYRAALTWSQGATDVRIGRQRIAWGTGRFFSPLDLLNPFSPIALERGERMGVDAVLVEHKVGALSRMSAVYAPQHAAAASSAAVLWHGNHRAVDYSVVAGRFKKERVLGLDVAAQWGAAGIRAELTRNMAAGTAGYTRALLGMDYSFANTLSLSGELYRDGAGARSPAGYDFSALFARKVQNLGRRYAAAHTAYEITPLLKAGADSVRNLDDRSGYFSPNLTYSLRADLDATVGVQLFRGGAGSEYGALKNMVYAQLQWFF